MRRNALLEDSDHGHDGPRTTLHRVADGPEVRIAVQIISEPSQLADLPPGEYVLRGAALDALLRQMGLDLDEREEPVPCPGCGRPLGGSHLLGCAAAVPDVPRICPKCGASDSSVSYHASLEECLPRLYRQDEGTAGAHLHRTCRSCGWAVRTPSGS
jgi:hypothetical protein